MTSTYNNAMIDDIVVVIEPSERRMRDQRIGLCKKPQARIWTPDVSDITRNVLLVSNDVITMSFDVIVSIIPSQRHRIIVNALFCTSATTFYDELASHISAYSFSPCFVILTV